MTCVNITSAAQYFFLHLIRISVTSHLLSAKTLSSKIFPIYLWTDGVFTHWKWLLHLRFWRTLSCAKTACRWHNLQMISALCNPRSPWDVYFGNSSDVAMIISSPFFLDCWTEEKYILPSQFFYYPSLILGESRYFFPLSFFFDGNVHYQLIFLYSVPFSLHSN